MVRIFLLTFLVWRFHELAVAQTNPSLEEALQKHINQAHFQHASWGIQVVSLNSGNVLFENQPHKLLKPASNTKLYTGALALDRLGPDFSITTSVLARELPRDGAINGDLIVYGRGDFSLSARFHQGDYSVILSNLVEAISTAGVKTVKGDLVGDETYFRGPPLGSGWNWDDLQYYYGAEVSALTIQDNVIDLSFTPGAKAGDPLVWSKLPQTDFVQFIERARTLKSGQAGSIELYRPVGENTVYIFGGLALGHAKTTDAVAVHRPALWFVTLLKQALERKEIKIEGKPRTISWPESSAEKNLKTIAEIKSPPLSELLRQMMKPSQNLYAQLLLFQVAVNDPRHAKEPAQTTEEIGIKAMQEFVKKIGIAPGEVLLQEGSGLSRSALVTPAATVQLLRTMHGHAHADIFKNALPIAGVDGTLRNRFKSKGLSGSIRAKTGSLGNVSTLSGYTTNAAGEALVFSVMLNNYSRATNAPTAAEAVD